jgi:hypothetical protein
MNRIVIISIVIFASSCTAGGLRKQPVRTDQKIEINANIDGKGPEITLELTKGEYYYYPLMAAWLEDVDGNYIQTLFIPKSVATGIFRYGKHEKNKWIAAEKRAPQTLPYWSHKRGVIASDGLYMPEPANPVPDAYTGATPVQSFILNSKSDNSLPEVFRVLFEINQNWDWNEYWTNNKYPDDENYKMSCQPALVYEAVVDTRNAAQDYSMKPIGHSHYSGKTGELFTDLSTLTTAMHIADSIIVRVGKN